MRSRRFAVSACALLPVLTLAFALTGCSSILGQFLNPPSPLQGSWKLEAADALALAMTLTFDEDGALTNAAYSIGDVASIPDETPQATVEVSGDNVVIAALFSGNSLVFSGTFNEDQSVISGRVTGAISAGDLVVTLTNQAATLTRQ